MVIKMTDAEIAAQVGAKVSNYKITQTRRKTGEFVDSDHYGVALGQSESGNFATWLFHFMENGEVSFYWGHYFDSDKQAALDDFNTRD